MFRIACDSKFGKRARIVRAVGHPRMPWLSCANWLLVILVGMTVGLAGCREGEKQNRWLPAPVDRQPPYDLSGKGLVAWGDSFKMATINESNHELHQCIILGVDTPKPGQLFYNQATEATKKMIRHKMLTLRVMRRDYLNHECVFVYEGKLNVGLELVRQGWAWYDGEEFDGAEAYQEAEAQAREKKIGLWTQDDPVPPWEFYEQQQKKFKERLDGVK